MTAAMSNQGQVTRSAATGRRRSSSLPGPRWPTSSAAASAGIVFGRSMTQLTFDVSRAMAKTWGPGDRVVVTRLDHDANIRPWVYAAEAAGADLVWVDFDPATGELDRRRGRRPSLDDRTRLVAVTAASNLLGTRPDVAAIAAAAHEVGALVYVDGVHYSAHLLPDLRALGADLFVCSPYKFLGPHCGVLGGPRRAARDPAAGQAAAVEQRGAGALRAGHPAVRADGRHDRSRRLPRRARRFGLRQSPRTAAEPRSPALEAHEDALRGADRVRPARTWGPRSTPGRPDGPPRCCSSCPATTPSRSSTAWPRGG